MSRDRIRVAAPIRDARLLAPDSERANFGTPGTLDLVFASERNRAFARGVEEGRRLERSEATARLDDAVDQIVATQASAETALSKTAVELAITIARTLLRTEIRAGNYDLEGIVREALKETSTGRSACVVHLNPTDHARLADVKFRSGTKIQVDEGVALGEVQVETALGLLVRETMGALKSIEEALLEEIE